MSLLTDFLRRLVANLDAADVAYMVVGSLASTYHGEPRATQDVDMVVQLPLASTPQLIRQFPDDRYYISAEAAFDAVRRRSQFNVIDHETGWKADLVVLKQRPFSQLEFQRRVSAELLGIHLWLASAEDTIVTKLEWSSLTGSDRQFNDVVGIVSRPDAQLDLNYVNHWCAVLGIADLWTKLLDRVPAIQRHES